jgi:hypothetical protein
MIERRQGWSLEYKMSFALVFSTFETFIQCDTTIRALHVLAMKDATHISTMLLHLLRNVEI